MIIEAFHRVYNNFKMHFYHEIFKKWKGRELSLTTVETFCMEMIYALNKPTVSEFAKFASLSSANAADKINNLMSKGYLKKIRSKEDKRKYYLEPTQKYLDYYDLNKSYIDNVLKKVEERFTMQELETFHKILNVMDTELMDSYAEMDKR